MYLTLSTVILRFIHIVACNSSLFLLLLTSIIWIYYSLLIQLPVYWYLYCFYFEVIVNKATISFCVDIVFHFADVPFFHWKKKQPKKLVLVISSPWPKLGDDNTSTIHLHNKYILNARYNAVCCRHSGEWGSDSCSRRAYNLVNKCRHIVNNLKCRNCVKYKMLWSTR